MELINKIRKSRKGFTLVEIIVVLVILAILAAFTIPTMLGFVGDAKGKAYIAEAREVYVAAQSTATEYSAKTALFDNELALALGSNAVRQATTAPAVVNPPTVAYNQALASNQMFKYIGTDLTYYGAVPAANITAAQLGSTASAWTVTVGVNNAAGKTGKVNSLIYYKNGYQVTISDGNASVVRLP